MTSALERRVAALEGSRRDDFKPAETTLFGSFAIAIVAYGDPQKHVRGRWKPGKESVLDAYARACRYRGGTGGLFGTACRDPGKFARGLLGDALAFGLCLGCLARKFLALFLQAHQRLISILGPDGER
jgi:hypothetical protein